MNPTVPYIPILINKFENIFITCCESQLTEKVRKVGENDVKRSTNQGAILARVKGQGACLVWREERGTQCVSQDI
jgi:hypothetical protein